MADEQANKCQTCDGSGEVVINAGYCGGCEICGSREEQTVPCPECNLPEEDDRDPEDY